MLKLYNLYFMHYNALLYNWEIQYLKLINVELYKLFETFMRDGMYSQFVIVVLVRAGTNLLLKSIWKLTTNKTKEDLAV